MGAIFKVKNGLNCRFWQDCWILNVPLKIAYEDLFKLVRDLEALVADYWDEGEWLVEFRRALSMQEYERWIELKGELHHTSLIPDQRDAVLWGLENKGLYTTKSLYSFILNGGSVNRIAGHIWKCKVPLKIKFLLWQIFNNKLQCAASLVRRWWKGGPD